MENVYISIPKGDMKRREKKWVHKRFKNYNQDQDAVNEWITKRRNE